MWDMVRAGEFLNAFVLFKDSSVDKAVVSQKWYNKIYQIHDIKKQEFDRSYTYYQKHPVLMKEILDSLTRKQVATTTYGQQSGPAREDSSYGEAGSPSIDTRIKIADSTLKKRLLKRKGRLP